MKPEVRYFLGVGAQKAGTTWLHDQLARHPQVAVPEDKELHFFDTLYPSRGGKSRAATMASAALRALDDGDLTKARRRLQAIERAFNGQRAYLDRLDAARTDETLVAGELTPAYSILTRTAYQEIRTLLNQPRIIFVMRDPIDRLWSGVRFSQRPVERHEELFNQLRFLRGGEADRADYPATVRLLDEVFGDRVHYCFYERLFSEESLRGIARFLGVDEQWDWHIAQVSNPGAPRPMPEPSPALFVYMEQIYLFVR
jgi:hypothetical protein